jgi:hypothetical protein
MSIFLDRDTKVIVQGITGKMAQYHTKDMVAYGTNVVGGGCRAREARGLVNCRCLIPSKRLSLKPALLPVLFLCHRPLQQSALWKPQMAASVIVSVSLTVSPLRI